MPSPLALFACSCTFFAPHQPPSNKGFAICQSSDSDSSIHNESRFSLVFFDPVTQTQELAVTIGIDMDLEIVSELMVGGKEGWKVGFRNGEDLEGCMKQVWK